MSITLKTPTKSTGHAPTDSGLGKTFSLSVSACRNTYLNNIKSFIKKGETDRKHEVARINKAYNDSREYIAQNMLDYLLENDGVVDAWPDPDTGISAGFSLSDDNDDDKPIDYDSYYYRFDYFGSDYESNKYGGISGGGRSYRNPYKYKDTQRIRSIKIHESNLLDEFKENNPLKFGWSLLIAFLIFLCFGGPLISTGYLYFLQRAADPEVVELAVEGFFNNFSGIFAIFDKIPKFLMYILIIIFILPYTIIMLLKFLPEMICALGGKSVIVLAIYGLIMFVAGFMAFGMIYAFVGEKIPSAKPVDGLICLIEYIKSKRSKERKEAYEENERLKEEYTRLMEDFHRRWYANTK